jgi:hypothetical protein
MPVYNRALFQELCNQLTVVMQYSPLNAAGRDPLDATAVTYYKNSLAEQLFVTIRTFVNVHPTAASTNKPHGVINLVDQGTINPALHTQIIEQLLCST